MSEKTAEEKLRQELEGSIIPTAHEQTSGHGRRRATRSSRKKPAKSEARSGSAKPDISTFMEDFGRKIEESLNAGSVFRVPEPAVEELHVPEEAPEVSHEVITPPADETEALDVGEEPITPASDIESTIETQDIPPETQDIQQEAPEAHPADEVPEALPDDTEPFDVQVAPINDDASPNELEAPDIETESTTPDEAEALDTQATPPDEQEIIPEIEPVDEDSLDDSDELPDIPVIEDNETEELDDEYLPLIDEPESTPNEEETPPEIPDDTPASKPELSEASLIEVADTEPEDAEEPFGTEPEDFTGILEADDEGITEEPPDDFQPSADVVLNVDSELPQIPDETPDPETETSPVSVTMPETTRTAEDKLMADIAEAMTGNPLSLESQETPAPYTLPGNFFASQDSTAGTQSAEDKLIANIAQAMSESPLGIAQEQAQQDLEQDLNPFDDVSLPEAKHEEEFLPGFDENTTTEQTEPEEEFLSGFGDNAEPEEESVSDVDEETAPEPEEEIIPDFGEDNTPEPEEEAEALTEIPDLFAEEAQDFSELPISDDDTLEPESEPLTEQQRLEREIANLSTQDTPPEHEDITGGIIPEPEDNTDIQIEEVSPENNMPEQSLINTSEPEDDINDDWDISSLGALSEATSMPDDDHEELQDIAIDEPLSEPEIQDTEEQDKEKTMSIREKLASRKNNAAKETPSSSGAKKSSSSGGGILTPLLLGLLLVVGVLLLFQLRTLNDRITASIINSGPFDAPSGFDAAPPSYDYAIDFILDPNINESMARRGRDGWQVVGSRRTQDSTTGQYGYEFIFMRRSR